MAPRKEFLRRLVRVSRQPDCNDNVVVQRADLQRLINEFEQVGEALLMLEYWVHAPIRMEQPPNFSEVRLAVKLLRPQKRAKS